MPGGSANRNNIGRGGTNVGDKIAKGETEVVDRKSELIEKIINVLKTSFNNVAGVIVLAGGKLTDSVGE